MIEITYLNNETLIRHCSYTNKLIQVETGIEYGNIVIDANPCKYTYEEGEALYNSLEEKDARISFLKQQLQDTDYIVMKLYEGAATEEEYADKLAERKEWRKEINTLQEVKL